MIQKSFQDVKLVSLHNVEFSIICVSLNLQCTVMKLKWGLLEIKDGLRAAICCHNSSRRENIFAILKEKFNQGVLAALRRRYKNYQLLEFDE